LRSLRSVAVVILITLALVAGSVFAMGARPNTPATIEFKDRLKGLWLDHIQYERAFVQFTKDNNTDAARVSDAKAAKNARDLADAMGRYYGKDSTEKLYTLLHAHYQGIKEYTSASFAGNTSGKKAASDKLYKNSVELTGFIASINPYISKTDLSALIESHTGNTISDIDAVASKDAAADQEIYEIMQKNMKILSDELSEAIIRQFPKSF
jgi:hypothetical protein